MLTERDRVVSALRSRGDHDRALQAQCSLPKWVDSERDAGVLLQLDVEPADIEAGTTAAAVAPRG